MATREKLVQELALIKMKGGDRRAKRQEEMRDLLENHYAPAVQALADKGESFETEFEEIYRKALIELAKKEGMSVMPKDIFSLQVGLCREIHSHGVQLHQIHLLKKYYRKITKFLEKEVEWSKEEARSMKKELNASIHQMKFQTLRLEKEMEAKVNEQQKEIQKLRNMLGEKLTLEDVDDITELPLNVLKEMKTPKLLRRSQVWIDIHGPATDSSGDELDLDEFEDLNDLPSELKPKAIQRMSFNPAAIFGGSQRSITSEASNGAGKRASVVSFSSGTNGGGKLKKQNDFSDSERSLYSAAPTRPSIIQSFSRAILNVNFGENSDSSLEDYIMDLPEPFKSKAASPLSRDNSTDSLPPPPPQDETPTTTKKPSKGSEDTPTKRTPPSAKKTSMDYVIDPTWSEDSACLSPTTRQLKMLSAKVFSDSWRPMVEERYIASDTEDQEST